MIERLVDHRPLALAAPGTVAAPRSGLESPPLPAATFARSPLVTLTPPAPLVIPTRTAFVFAAPVLGRSLGSMALAG
jgi:hypothetical protein